MSGFPALRADRRHGDGHGARGVLERLFRWGDALDSSNLDTPGAAARAMARQQCRIIARSLARRRDVHAGIHQARKAMRRLRAVLALVEARFEQVPAIDRALQRLGAGLSRVRDAHVAVELAHAFAAEGNPEAWQPAIAFLTRRRDRLAAQLAARDPGFSRRLAVVGRQAAALEAVEWSRLRGKDLRAGLERGLARVARAERRARKEPSAENLHRFRRRLRRLRMQQQALRSLAPAVARDVVTGKHIRSLSRRSDRLGRRRDVQALYGQVRRAPGLPDRRLLLDQLREELPS